MKKIIVGVVYNTETSELLAENWNGVNRHDRNFLREEIYRTKNGRYFLFGEGGTASKYATINYGFVTTGEAITPLNEDELFELLQDWNEVEIIETLFPDRIQEA